MSRLAAVVAVIGVAAVLLPSEPRADPRLVCDIHDDGVTVDGRAGECDDDDDEDCRRGVKPCVLSLRPTQSSVPRGGTGVLTLQIQNPSHGTGVRIRLYSSNPAVASVPSQLDIPVRVFRGNVVVTGVAVGGPVTITATLNSTSVSAYVTVVGGPPSPTIAEPLIEGSTVVGGTGLAGAVVDIQVDGALVGTGTVATNGTFQIAVSRLSAGAIVRATQTVAGLTSLPSGPVTVHAIPPAPLLTAPLVEGVTTVRVTGSPAAVVAVYVDGVKSGTGPIGSDGSVSIVVAPLVAGQQVTATQTVDGIESTPSAPQMVVAVPPPPLISTPLVAASVLVGGTGTAGGTVEVFIERVSSGTTIVSPSGSWSLAVPALTAGSSVSARQTVAGITSAFSPTVTVVGLPPAPALNLPLVATTTHVGGTGVTGALVSLRVDQGAAGTATVAPDGTWSVALAVPLTAGQVVEASEAIGGVSSALSASATVVPSPPAPLVDEPIVAGSTSISGAGTVAASVGVFVDGGAGGSVLVGLNGGWTVALAAPLSGGQIVEARQTLGGVTGTLSPAVVVLAPPPPPVLDSPRVAGDAQITGTGLSGAGVEVFTDAHAVGSTSVNPDFTWALPVAPLEAGEVITATQTVAGLHSARSSPVTVGAAVLHRIDITPTPTATLAAGRQVPFVARGTFSDGSIAQPLAGVIWRSDNPLAATIDATGLAVGIAPGVATIQARSGTITSAGTQLTVIKGDQGLTITAHAPPAAAYNASFTVAAVASSGLPVAITTTGVCQGAGSGSATISMTSGTGACVVAYAQPGDTTFNAAGEITESTTARPLAQTISVTQAPPPAAIFATSFTVAATASSGLPVGITTSGRCSGSGVAGATVTMTSGTGTCTVRFDQSGDGNYTAAPTVTGSTIAQTATQMITVTQPAPGNAVFQASFSVAATASSGLPVGIASSGVCAGSGVGHATVTMTSGTGGCTVTFDQAGDVDHGAAPTLTELTAAQTAAQTITLTQPAPAAAVYETTFIVAATASSGLPVGITTVGPCAGSGEASASVTMTGGTGTCTIMFDQPGDANYAAAPQRSQSVAALKGGTTTAVTTSQSPSTSGSVVTFTAFVSPTEATGTVTFSDRSTALGSGRVIAGTASLSTSQLAAGAQPITASYSGDDNYAGSTSPAIVQLVDTPPLAAPDAYAVLQNRTLVVETPGVLANDTDIDGNQPLTALLVSPPSWTAPDGFTFNADGSFTYVPRAGFTGVDTFTYRATDGIVDGEPVLVTIAVLAETATPVALNDAYATSEGARLDTAAAGLLGLLSNDNGQTLRARLVSGPLHAAPNGFALNADGSLIYVPSPGFTGVDSLLYEAHDGTTASNLATVTITVLSAGAAPVAPNAAHVADANQPGLRTSAANHEQPIVATLVNGPLYGTLSDAAPLAADGSFTYTPPPGFAGADSFIYRAAAADGRSNLATVTIRVTAVTIAAPSVTFGEDGSVSVSVSSPAGPPGDEVALIVDDDQPRTTAPEPSGLARFTLTGLNAGAHRLGARYTNSDYQGAATATATLSVDKATPVISWLQPPDIAHGTALGGAQLNAQAIFKGRAVLGTYTYDPPAGTVLSIGRHTLHVTFGPADANFNTASTTVTIDVTPALITRLAVAPSSAELLVGQTLQFRATAARADGTSDDVTSVVTWTSAPPSVATIGGDTGLATALGAGLSTVTATHPGGATATAKLRVTPLPVVQFSAPTYSVIEGAPTAVITAVRTGTLSSSFGVSYAATALTAVAGRDFTPVAGALTFGANVSQGTFSVPVFDNLLVVGDRTVALTLGPPLGAVLGGTSTAILTIKENDQPGTFQVAAASYTVGENAGSVLVTIVRAGTRLAGNVSVDFSTVDGAGSHGARAGINYTAVSGTATFNAGETTKDVVIPILPDGQVTDKLTFGLTLSHPTSGATLGARRAASIVIQDQDRPGIVQLDAVSYSVDQGAGRVRIGIVRRNGSGGGVSVAFQTADGTAKAGRDYRSASATVTFATNQSTGFVTIPVIAHDTATGDRKFSVSLSNPGSGATLGTPIRAVVTIVDDHAVIQLSGKSVGNSVEVVRGGGLAANVSVDYHAASGTAIIGKDFILEPGTLVFPPGVTSRLIPVVIVDDHIAEGNETFTIALSDPSPGAVLGRNASHVFTILDNDFGGTLNFAKPTFTAPRGSNAEITITRTGGQGTILTVTWGVIKGGSAVAGTDFSPASGTVTFDVNDASQTFTVNLPDLAAGSPRSDKTVVFGLQFPKGAAEVGATKTATLKIVGR